MQPGETITPGQQPPSVDEQPIQAVTSQEIPQPIQPVIPPTTPIAEQPAAGAPAPLPVEVSQQAPISASDDSLSVRWTASEYIDHAKGSSWFMLMGICLFVLVIAVYFVLRDVVAPILLALAGITFGVFAGRRPEVREYIVDAQGIHIGNRLHAFEDFKSFSVTDNGPLPAILLTPLRRFLPPLTIFYDPKEEDRIMDGLANYLPYEDKEPDLVDKLMSRIRF